MGDRAYTRFSIPIHRLSSDHGEHLCQVFTLSPDRLDDLFQRPPLSLEAGHNNDTSLRLVQGYPCLVIEDDDTNYAGSAEESELENSGIPFLRINEVGDEYGPSQTVFDGSESITIRNDFGGNAIVGVGISLDGTVQIDEEEIADIRRFVKMSKEVLSPG